MTARGARVGHIASFDCELSEKLDMLIAGHTVIGAAAAVA